MKIDFDTQVCILCGGKGTRLKPLTNDIPKPLIEIGGNPMLHYIMKHFLQTGLKNFIIATGYKHELIENYFYKNHNNINIEVVNSGNVDILQRIIDTEKLIKGKFIVAYGDTIADIDIDQLLEFDSNHEGEVTVSSYQSKWND